MRRGYVAEELADGAGDLDCMCFKSKMSSVEELNFSVRKVAPVCLSARRDEEGIVFAPNGKERRLFRGKVFVEFGIEGNIVRIVEEKIKLDLVVARS